MLNNKNKYLLPLIISVSVAAGIGIGSFFTLNSSSSNAFTSAGGSNKLNALFEIIKRSYVDTVSVDKLVEDAMPVVISELDPHSSYIKAEDLKAVSEDLEGHFSGIGVSFNMQTDTITVINVISGGPAEKVGILPGDRIVEINDTLFVGKEVSTEKVMKRLRGEKNTSVKVGVKRFTSESLLPFTIVRDDIPVYSVDTSYEIDKGVGYIKISRFGATTYSEFISALAKLKSTNCDRFIIDLRGNLGGYMEAAVNMVNEFLPANQLIVYTEGKLIPRDNLYSNGTGSFQNAPVAVLLDEWSASASEIFAGAVQDNDRGLVVGRRSFGKGLVQQQMPFSDGSAIRLTIARYYTPSGRCIQKKYEMGKGEDYELDLMQRYERGEFFSKDSIKQEDSTVYYTTAGRVVYGGGGIMPDIFIARDTTKMTPYFNAVLNLGLTFQFAFRYSDMKRDELKKCGSAEEAIKYLMADGALEQFIAFAESKGVARNQQEIAKSRHLLEDQVFSYICRNTIDDEAFFKIFYRNDETLLKAVEEIKKSDNNVNQLPKTATEGRNS